MLHATNRHVDLIDERFDLAVRAHSGALPCSDLVQRCLGLSPVYLVASPAYLQRRGTPGQPQDIARHDGLLASLGSARPGWRLRNKAGQSIEAQPVSRFVLDEPLTLLNAATAGLGIACLPYALCRPQIEAGTLMRVLPEWTAKGAIITNLTPQRRLRLPAVRVIADFLAAELPRVMGIERIAAAR